MSTVSETLPFLESTTLPLDSWNATKVVLGALILALMACTAHYASPMRLTRVMVSAIAAAEIAYFEAIEAGMIPKSDVDTATTLTRLQIKVSIIREMCLRNSLSYRAALYGFVKGNTLTVLQCLRKVRVFEAHIEILKEGRLRASDATSESATRVVSLRQRQKTARV
ncbi:hypothetical protein FB451DRAFT_1551430 [Mycena latifolia]|nr:hypothetical protein FB451DRAFT_1551430 [Mycena latifolia]